MLGFQNPNKSSTQDDSAPEDSLIFMPQASSQSKPNVQDVADADEIAWDLTGGTATTTYSEVNNSPGRTNGDVLKIKGLDPNKEENDDDGFIPFRLYRGTPNNTCADKGMGKSLCGKCASGDLVLKYLREQQTPVDHAQLHVISLDFLAVIADEARDFSSQVTSALDKIIVTKEYLHFGGSDNIFLCLLSGCSRVLQEITQRHPVGKDTRAMWVTVPSEMGETERELWPCPDRVLLTSDALELSLIPSSLQDECTLIDEAILYQEIGKVLNSAHDKVKGANRWKCSKERWNVDLSHLKTVLDQGCQEIPRHQLCISSIPKCATSTLNALVRRMNDNPSWNTSNRYNHGGPGLNWCNPMKDYERYERIYTNTTHIRILVVRNPEKRFISAYMDKIYSLHEYGRIWYRGKSVPTLDAVADHFYKISLNGKMAHVDKHFKPIHNFASVGSSRYDFVARVESLAEDFGAILTSLGLYDMYLASGWGPNGNLSFAEDMGANIGHKMPPTVKYSPKSLEQIRTIYKEDYDMFDYRRN